MEKKGYGKEFAKYAFFNVIGMLGISFYILADTYFIAKGMGEKGLAALNLVLPIYGLIYGIGLMFGIGGGTKYSILQHQKKEEEANQVFTQGLLWILLFGVVFEGLGIFGAREISGWLGASGEVFEMSYRYLRVVFLFAPMFLLGHYFGAFVRNDGQPRLAMAAVLVGSLFNVLLDYVFIFVFHWGMEGAALATGASPVVGLLLLSFHVWKGRNRFHFCRPEMSWKVLKGIISGGFPTLIGELSSGIVIFVFNWLILGLEGNLGVAAYGVIANLSLIVVAVFNGIAQGSQPLLSKYYGQGKKEQVEGVFRLGYFTILILGLLVYLGMFLGAEKLAMMFHAQGKEALQKMAVSGLRLYFLATVFVGENILIGMYYASRDRGREVHWFSLFRGLIFIVPITILFAKIAGMFGIWLAFPATEGIVFLLGVGKLYRDRKKLALPY